MNLIISYDLPAAVAARPVRYGSNFGDCWIIVITWLYKSKSISVDNSRTTNPYNTHTHTHTHVDKNKQEHTPKQERDQTKTETRNGQTNWESETRKRERERETEIVFIATTTHLFLSSTVRYGIMFVRTVNVVWLIGCPIISTTMSGLTIGTSFICDVSNVMTVPSAVVIWSWDFILPTKLTNWLISCPDWIILPLILANASAILLVKQ